MGATRFCLAVFMANAVSDCFPIPYGILVAGGGLEPPTSGL